jgi:pimeloyl-ACP methyl ester carboxylesterase
LFTWTEVLLPRVGRRKALARVVAAKNLADKYELIALDLPGHGFTTTYRGGLGNDVLKPDRAAESVLRFMWKQGISKATLVGHSFGGLVACHAARLAPQRVEALVLIEPEGLHRDKEEYLPSEKMLREDPEGCVSGCHWLVQSLGWFDWILSLKLHNFLKFMKFRSYWEVEADSAIREMSQTPVVVDAEQRKEYATLMQVRENYDSNRYLVRRSSGLDHDILEAVGKEYGDKTLLIWGDRDGLFPMPKHSGAFARWFDTTPHVVHGAGHLITENAPAEIIEAIWQRVVEER